MSCSPDVPNASPPTELGHHHPPQTKHRRQFATGGGVRGRGLAPAAIQHRPICRCTSSPPCPLGGIGSTVARCQHSCSSSVITVSHTAQCHYLSPQRHVTSVSYSRAAKLARARGSECFLILNKLFTKKSERSEKKALAIFHEFNHCKKVSVAKRTTKRFSLYTFHVFFAVRGECDTNDD